MSGRDRTGGSPVTLTDRPAREAARFLPAARDCNPFLRLTVWLTAFLVFGSAGPLLAQTDVPPPPQGNLPFTADVGTTRSPAGRITAHIYLEIPYSSLRFSRSGTDWAAGCDVTIVIQGRKNEQVNGDLWSVPIHSAADPSTGSRTEVFRRRFDLPVTPGRLRFEVTVSQTDTGREGTWTYTMEVPPADRSVAISDFVFGLCSQDSTPLADWSEGGFTPWTRRRYGEENPLACVKGELYDRTAAADSVYQLRCQILNGNGHSVVSWNEEVPRANGRGEFLLHPSIVDLTLGAYKLRLDVAVGGDKARRERWFEIDETRVNIFDDPKMIRTVIGYVAQNDEILLLEDMPTDSLQAFWDAFWLRRDPTPGTPRNERLAEFLRRIEYVNQRYSILEPGWTSDMGRIYIRYGAPDQVDRTPYSNAGPPREVWYYLERGLRFDFLDTEGFGRFRLVGSTRQ